MTISEKIWNLIAPVYGILRRNPVSGYFLNKEKLAIESLLEKLNLSHITTICDLGVGRGNGLNFIPDTIEQKMAIDKSMTMIQYTKKDFPGTNFIQADVCNLPLKSESFELIICIGLIEYIPNLEPLIEQLAFILNYEGHIILSYSPRNIFTYLRFLRGHRIYARNSIELEKNFRKYQLKISELKVTPMQYQYLLRKIR